MTEEATFQIKVKVKNRDEFKRDVQKMLDESGYLGANVKRMKSAGGGGGGLGGGFLGSFKGLGKMLGSFGAVLMIADQFKGLTNLISAILRTVTEFLRPIADVVMLLLMPVLMILRPILMIVRQMMAPFRKSAFQLAALGTKMIKNGDVTGGLGMFGQAIMTILAGFVPILTNWWGILLKFVVDIGAGFIKMFAGVIFDLGALIAKGIDAIAGFFGIKTELEKGVRDAQENFNRGVDGIASQMTQTLDDNIAAFNKTFTEWVIGAAKKTIDAATAQLEAADQMKKAAGGYLDAQGLTHTVIGPNGAGMSTLKGYEANMSSQYGPAHSASPEEAASLGMGSFTKTVEEGFVKQNDLATAYYSTQAPSTLKYGFTAMNDLSMSYVGPGGTIPTTYNKGFDTVRGSMNNFSKAMLSASGGIVKAIDQALSAGKKAVSEAEKYARALRALEAKRS